MKFYSRYILLVFFSLTTLYAHCQSELTIFPNQIHDNGLTVTNCFCPLDLASQSPMRNLEGTYQIIGEGQFTDLYNITTDTPTTFQSRRIASAAINAFVVNTNGFKLLAGYLVNQETYKIKTVAEDRDQVLEYLSNKSLTTTGYHVSMIKTIGTKMYAVGKLKRYFSGDLENIVDYDRKFASTIGTLFVGYKRNEEQVFGAGLRYSADFKNNQLTPILFYKYNFQPTWGLEMILPYSVYLKNYRNETTIVSIGADYTSSLFNINYGAQNVYRNYAFNQSAIKGTILIEKRIAKWFWFSSKIGYQASLTSDFKRIDISQENFTVKQTATPFFELSIFMSIPKRNAQ